MAIVMIAPTGVASAQAVGPEIPIWVDAVPSYRPSVAFDIIHEQFLVVWYNEQGPAALDVYARRVNLDGSLSTWFSIVAGMGEKYFNPVVAYNQSRQEYLVVWTREFSTTDHDLWGSLVAWNGSTVGTPFFINLEADKQDFPAVTYNPNDDEYLVVYGNAWAGGLRDIAAQRVDGDGSLLSWANISTSASADRYSPTVAFSPELDSYLIGYTRDSGLAAGIDVAGKIAAPDLAGVSPALEITIADDGTDDLINAVVGATAGGFIAQYNPISTPYGAAVRARRLAGDGTPLGPASGFPVATSVPAVNLGRTNAVARADAVGYVSAWENFGANYTQIYAQAISPFSDRILGPLYAYPVDYGNSWNRDPDIACAPWGTCLVVYESDKDIVARLIQMHVFGDHFESGTTSAWSAVAP
jgi:hypothetical protein